MLKNRPTTAKLRYSLGHPKTVFMVS